VFTDPIQERSFESDIVSEPLGFDPLVSENLLPLREEFLVKAGLLYEVPGRFGRFKGGVGHGYHGEAWVKRMREMAGCDSATYFRKFLRKESEVAPTRASNRWLWLPIIV